MDSESRADPAPAVRVAAAVNLGRFAYRAELDELAEHDAQAYVPKEEIEQWKVRDPIERYVRVLLESRVATAEELSAIDQTISGEVDREVEFAEKSPFPSPEDGLKNVYAASAAELEPLVVRRRS